MHSKILSEHNRVVYCETRSDQSDPLQNKYSKNGTQVLVTVSRIAKRRWTVRVEIITSVNVVDSFHLLLHKARTRRLPVVQFFRFFIKIVYFPPINLGKWGTKQDVLKHDLVENSSSD